MAITDAATLKAWNPGALDAVASATLDRVLASSQRYVEDYTSRKFELVSYTELFDGDNASGKYHEVIQLNRGRWPAAITSVAENGVTLSTAAGYSTTANVIIVGQNEERPMRLIRALSQPPSLSSPRSTPGWAPGVQNITVVYGAGYAANVMPAVVVQAVLEVAYVMLRTGRTVNVSSQGKGGHTVALMRDLSPATKQALDQIRAW